MNTTILNNGNEIPLVGLGTWRMNEATYDSVLTALKAGYRHIDTAMIYNNEKEVGRAIADSGVTREDLFVTTKLWNDDHRDVLGAFNLSLKKLGLDYIDLYLMHWPLPSRVVAYREMEKLLDTGRTKAIGVSNFTIRHLEEFLPQVSIVPAVNQVEFNPFLNQSELKKYCEDKGIVLEAYCPLTHGTNLKNEKLVSIAKKYDKSAAQIMLRWSTQQGIVVIPKSTNEARIAENLASTDFDISNEDMTEISSWNEDTRVCSDPTEMP